MGEIADDLIDSYIGAGGWSFGRGRRRHRPPPVCKYCGEEGLKWRLNDAGEWRLYSEERGEHNEKLQHNCRATDPADAFEVEKPDDPD